MLKNRNSLWAASSLGLVCLLLAGVNVGAGDKQGAILSKQGVLKEDDAKDTKLTTSPSTKYPIKLTAGKTYRIDLKSTDFDSFLRLEDSTGKEVAFDDDGGGFPDAQINYKAPKTGDYTIIVTSYDKKAGNFTLTVVEAAPPIGNSRFQAKAITLTLKDGKASDTNELNAKDAVFQKHFFKIFTVNLDKGKTYRFDNRDLGDKASPLLFLEDGDGNQLEADGGRADDASIVYKVAKAGAYRLVATTGRPSQTGKFILEIAPETDPKLLKQADLKYRINNFASLSGAQRKNLVQEISKSFQDKGGNLTIPDIQLAFQFANEAEMEDVDLARDILKDYAKMFAGSANKQIAAASKQFEMALKNLDKLGKVIEITGKTTTGKDFDLKNLKGKVVLVDFWGTWCPPCVAEIPNMVKAYEKYHNRGFDVIAITSDKDDDVVLKFMESRQLPWACINVEDSRTLIKMHGINSYPTPMLVDQAGRLISLRARGPQLERLLERLLAEKK
jgi:thiol-disulfide isomerase/thioredoxin